MNPQQTPTFTRQRTGNEMASVQNRYNRSDKQAIRMTELS